MTRQEMFNKAYLGLKSQGFKPCVDARGHSTYDDGNGRHCAWGWVDEESWGEQGPVLSLKTKLVNAARDSWEFLSKDCLFISGLQSCHDDRVLETAHLKGIPLWLVVDHYEAQRVLGLPFIYMDVALHRFAMRYGLDVP